MKANTMIVQFSFAVFLFFIQSLCLAQNAGTWKLPVVAEPVFKKDTFNISKYGAVNDGITLNTKSINDAISECNAKGGGVVFVPNGLWLTGPVELKNNVNLHLQENATLLFTTDKSQYALIETNWEGVPAVRNQSPISGKNLENIAITGKGIIDGNGDAWRQVKKSKLTSIQWKDLVVSGGLLDEKGNTWYPSQQFYDASKLNQPGVLLNGKTLKDYINYKNFFRPNLIVLTSCKKILLEGPTFQNSAAWGLHPLMCENLTIRNIFVRNPWYAQNGDGLDVESCSNVLIEDSRFDVGDDGICIKSGKDEEGRKRAMPTQDLIVRNCIVYHAHGGFVIGSEMSGGAKNIFVENCTFTGTDIGLRFKTKRGRGGIVENIFIRNIYMKNIMEEAILFDMYYEGKEPSESLGKNGEKPKVEIFPVTESTPQFRNFYIENVVCSGAEIAVFFRGLPEMSIKDIYLQNMIIQAKKGIDLIEAENIRFKNVQVMTADSNSVIKINNSSKIEFDGLKYKDGAELLFEVTGAKSAEIKVMNTDTSKAKNKTKLAEGVKAKSIQVK